MGERRLRKPAHSLTTNKAQNACPTRNLAGLFLAPRGDGGPLGERRLRKPETFLATASPTFDSRGASLLAFTGRGDQLTRSPFPDGMTSQAERRGRPAEAGCDQQK